ncbi:MAG: acetyl-CoA carboxylase carboxyl transferase subunit beta, partial [Candidatus Marinimicrobia bacterium]|nr:acetyl-CoA carboxylase carboxyl transferase subunit beta [Candidatus Neomarinimicrobiota bacterium]
MSWFKRKDKKFKDPEKKSIPDGLWDKCPSCDEILYRPELEKNLSVCHHCEHHFRVAPQVYVDLLLDKSSETHLYQNLESKDFL